MARVAHAPAAPGVGRKAGSRWLRRRSPGWRRPGWCPWYQLSAQGERTRQQGDLTCTATTFTKAWSHHGETAAVPPPHYARACREVTSAGNGAWRLQRCPKQEVGSGCSIQWESGVHHTTHLYSSGGVACTLAAGCSCLGWRSCPWGSSPSHTTASACASGAGITECDATACLSIVLMDLQKHVRPTTLTPGEHWGSSGPASEKTSTHTAGQHLRVT